MRDTTVNKRVLLIDDDMLALTAHRLPLTRLGFRVDEAINGQEALDKLIKDIAEYNLVLVDYNLPDFNGAIVTQKIRQFEKTSNLVNCIPIIGITAHVDEQIKNICLSAGMNEVISKPVFPDKLKTLVNEYGL